MTTPPADNKDIIVADEDIFEISDFTVVTDLEGLIASLENILHNVKNTWLVATNSAEDNITDEESPYLRRKRDELTFYFQGRELTLNYFYDSRGPPPPVLQMKFKSVDLSHVPTAGLDITAYEHHFRECSSISRQFGVSSYILIRPIDFTIDEKQLQTMLSAIEVATHAVDFEVPVFLQFGDLFSDLFFGLCKNRSTSISFDSARLRKPMTKHKFLDGAKQMFLEKACSSISGCVNVSVKFDYAYRKASPTPSVVAERDSGGALDGDDGGAEPGDSGRDDSGQTPATVSIDYPFGADFDPFSELSLSTCWINVGSGVVIESSTYSDADPPSAPKWFVSVTFHDDAKYALSSMLSALLDCREGPCAACLLSSFASKWTAPVESSAANAFNSIATNFAVNQLTFRSSSSSTTTTGDEKSRARTNEPLSYATRCLNECLRLAQESEANLPNKTDQPVATSTTKDDFSALKASANSTLRYVKGAPLDSLTSYMARAAIAAFLRDVNLELDAMALLWQKFLDHLRNAWESCTSLIGLATDAHRLLDLSQCLLHQKLQMVDVCIRTKSERHTTWNSQCEQGTTKTKNTVAGGEDDEDNFFDANESFNANQEDDVAAKPVGRARPLDESTFLLKYPEERLIYVPVTQDFGPMTEDRIEEQTSYLTSLDSESGERTRAQLDILLSDMQAFKAANPGAVLEDFVRWHSPRDFDPTADEGRGALSDRMCQVDSVWAETWRNARPIPVGLQSRLFNETKEVETILQSFERITVARFIDLLLPVVILDAVRLLIDKCEPCPSLVYDRLMALCRRVKKCSKMWTLDDFIDVRNEVEAIEVLISRYVSIQSLLSASTPPLLTDDTVSNKTHLHEFISALLATERSGAEVLRQQRSARVKVFDAPRGPLAESIYDCFKRSVDLEPGKKFKMPAPIRKQYIFRTTHPRPSDRSRPVPHRMYVSVTEDPASSEPLDYHLSGSFSSDVTLK